MDRSEKLVTVAVCLAGVCLVLVSGDTPDHPRANFKGTQFIRRNSEFQPLESSPVSEVDYVDGPLAPLYDFLIQHKLQRFCKLLRDAGLEQVIKDLGESWTLFAPTDVSFIFLPGGTLEELQRNPALLRDFILYHFIASDFPSSQIENELLVDSVQGTPLRFNIYGQTMTVSGAEIIEPDLQFEMGRVHIIDRPLYPIPSEDEYSYLQKNYRKFFKLLQDSEMLDWVTTYNTFTLLIPDDQAFDYLSVELKDAMATNVSLAKEIVYNHILIGTVYVGGITDGMKWNTLGTVDGIQFTVKRGLIFANGIPIVLADIPLKNSVAHVINRVILPEGIEAECQCKPSSEVPDRSSPAFEQPQRPPIGQIATTLRPGQAYPRQTPSPVRDQTRGSPGTPGSPRLPGTLGSPSLPGQGGYPSRPQSPITSPSVRPLSPSRSGQPVRPLSPPDQPRSPYSPESPSDDDINAVIQTEGQPGAGPRKPDQSRTTKYPPPPAPRQRVTPRPPQIAASHTTRRNQGGSYPGSENENYPEQEVTPNVPHTTKQADSWSNRQRTPAPRYPTPQRGSYNTPTTRRPQTTRTYDWNQQRLTQPSIQQPDKEVEIDSGTKNQGQGQQAERPGTQTTSWQQRNQITQTTRQPFQRNTFQTTPRQPRPPQPRITTPRPSYQRPTTSAQIPSINQPLQPNQEQPNCRRSGDRITALTRNLPLCSESAPDGCQNPPYNPSDSRPLCPQLPVQNCRSPNDPFDPSDNRPLCPPDSVPEDCRQLGEPTYVGDRRPLCSSQQIPQTGCRDPSAPYNPSDRRPVCRSTDVSEVPSLGRQGVTSPQGCRQQDEIADLQDTRPLCPDKKQEDCRPLLERPRPGDRRPVCKVSQSDQSPKPVKDTEKPPKKVEKPQPQTTYSPRGQYPTQTTRRQSWQSTTRSPQSYPTTTTRRQPWQSTTRTPQNYPTQTTRRQSWQSPTRAPQSWQTTRQPVVKQPQSGTIKTQQQSENESFQNQPRAGSRPSQPHTGVDINPQNDANLSPETDVHSSQPHSGTDSSQPQSGRYPTQPQSGRYPSQQQPGSYPSQQSGRYPSQPQSGTLTTQPQRGTYPSQPQTGTHPSQPQGGAYPPQQQPGYPLTPDSPQSGSYPSQPSSGAHPSQPQSGSYPSHDPANPLPGTQTQPQSGSYPSQQQPGSGVYPQTQSPQRPGSSYPSQHPSSHLRPQPVNPPSTPHSGNQPSQPQTGRPSQPGIPAPGYPQRRPSYPQSQPGITTPPSPQTQGVSQPGFAGRRPSQPITPQGRPGQPITPEGRPGQPITPQGRPGQPITPQGRPGQPITPQGRPGSNQRPQTGSFGPVPAPVSGPTTTRRPISVTGTSTTPGEDSRRTLYEIVEDPALLIRGRPVHLTRIFELFHKAGIEDILNGPGPMTVFLPSDDAFGWLPKGAIEQLEENPELLRQILLYHVAETEILPSPETESYTVPSLEGNQLVITMLNGGKLILISGAKAVAVTRASNGIFYVINQLLYPLPQTDIVSAIQSRPDLTTLAYLLSLSGLENTLRGQTPYTLLAPTDTAFAQLSQPVYDELTRNTTALQEILLNHIIEGAHYGREFFTGGTFPSARGGKLKFQVVSYGYQVNEVNIKTPEIVTGTGVIHLIDQVLLEEPDLLFITNIENSVIGNDDSFTNPEQPGLDNQQPTHGQDIATGRRPVTNERLPGTGSQQPGQGQVTTTGRRPVTDERLISTRPGVNQPQLGGLQPSVGQPGFAGRIPVPGQGVSANQPASPGHSQGQFGGQRQPVHSQQTPGQSPGSVFGGRQPSTPGVRQPTQGQFQPSRTPVTQPGQQTHRLQVPGQSGHSAFGGQSIPSHGQHTQSNSFDSRRQPVTQTGGQTFSGGNPAVQTDGQPNNVADLARSMGLNQFANWVTNTGLLEKIHDGGVYTVFAPTDDAVSTLPQDMVYSIESDPEKVKPILQYHIVPQRLNLNSVTNEETASTLLTGKSIRFNVYKNSQPDCRQLVTASGTPVGEALATMGSIQVIPVTQVLYQPSGNLQNIVEASPILQRLNDAIKSARLTWVLSGTGPMTIFAPSDTAFDSLTEDEKKALLDNKQAFSDLLKRHIIRGTFFSSGIQDDLEKKSENNKPIKLSLQEGILTVNSIPVTYSDITATNGVLHVIDQFL